MTLRPPRSLLLLVMLACTSPTPVVSGLRFASIDDGVRLDAAALCGRAGIEGPACATTHRVGLAFVSDADESWVGDLGSLWHGTDHEGFLARISPDTAARYLDLVHQLDRCPEIRTGIVLVSRLDNDLRPRSLWARWFPRDVATPGDTVHCPLEERAPLPWPAREVVSVDVAVGDDPMPGDPSAPR